MKKYAFLSGIIGVSLGVILVCIGAWTLVTHQEGASAYFKGGILLIVASAIWFIISLRQFKQTT